MKEFVVIRDSLTHNIWLETNIQALESRTKMRIRIKFAKTDAMRFTSHLDLYRTLVRTFRRAGLPLAFSEGYNPRARINLAHALPLGYTSQGELVDVWLTSEVPLDGIQEAILGTLPPGIELLSIEEVDPKTPKTPNLVQSAEYIVTLYDPFPELEEQLNKLLAADTLPRVRREKEYDLRPLIKEMEVLPEDDKGLQQFSLKLAARPDATGRPDEVILALGIDPHKARVRRTRLILAEG